jgi:hypothetical protein
MRETPDGLRAYVAAMVCRLQQEAADLYAAASEERDTGGAHVDALQRAAARCHASGSHWLDVLGDDQYIAEWCANINHARDREDEHREAEARQRAAMTPEERDLEERASRGVGVMLHGLFTRDVQ